MMMNIHHHNQPSSSPNPQPPRNPNFESQSPIPSHLHPLLSLPTFPDLERRTITLSDGSIRTYLAIPPENLWAPHHPRDQIRESVLRYGNPSYPDVEPDRDQIRESVLRYGNPSYPDVEPDRVANSPADVAVGSDRPERPPKRARREDRPEEARGARGSDLESCFLELIKEIVENKTEMTKYLEMDGKEEPVHCIVCGRTSRSFARVHDLIMHTYTTQKQSELRVGHLALHKALCVLRGWDYTKAPETSKVYQSLSADAATANKEDLILWPPTVIIHNTSTRKKNGRMEGLSNEEMESKLKELGFTGCNAKSLFNKAGHLGITAVNFVTLDEADKLVKYFEKDNRGRKGWACDESSHMGNKKKASKNDQIWYGYLATAFDLEKVDIDTKKKFVIKSRKELNKLK